MILYVENSEESTKNLFELINKFSKVVNTRSIYKNKLHFYTLAMNKPKYN